jgi:hypothetical protein
MRCAHLAVPAPRDRCSTLPSNGVGVDGHCAPRSTCARPVSPVSAAHTATSARDLIPSLIRMLATCRSVVLVAITSSSAISELRSPRAICAATSRSRRVSTDREWPLIGGNGARSGCGKSPIRGLCTGAPVSMQHVADVDSLASVRDCSASHSASSRSAAARTSSRSFVLGAWLPPLDVAAAARSVARSVSITSIQQRDEGAPGA